MNEFGLHHCVRQNRFPRHLGESAPRVRPEQLPSSASGLGIMVSANFSPKVRFSRPRDSAESSHPLSLRGGLWPQIWSSVIGLL